VGCRLDSPGFNMVFYILKKSKSTLKNFDMKKLYMYMNHFMSQKAEESQETIETFFITYSISRKRKIITITYK
jgi:hypothetical protein